MVDVLTMDGLRATYPDRKGCTPITVHSRVLGQDVTVCSEDLREALEQAPKKKGRPRGSSVKKGAKRPKVPQCQATETIVTRKGKKVCRCATPGNRQILPHSKCGLPKTN